MKARSKHLTGEFSNRREPGRMMRLKAHSQQHDLQRKQTKLSDKDTEKTGAAPRVFESQIAVVTAKLAVFHDDRQAATMKKVPKREIVAARFHVPNSSVPKHLCACNCVEAEEVTF